MEPQRYFYRVFRLNDDHTTLVSSDIFKFNIKVLYHSIHTDPTRLQYCFPSQSILSQNFFQEGQNFLRTLLSRTGFSIDSLEEITESVVSTVRELFQVGDRVTSDQHRVIPLSLKIFILNSGVQAVMEEPMQCCGIMECCSVCLEELDMKAESFTTPCHHVFHLQCILPWLQIRHVCPLCRNLLPNLRN